MATKTSNNKTAKPAVAKKPAGAPKLKMVEPNPDPEQVRDDVVALKKIEDPPIVPEVQINGEVDGGMVKMKLRRHIGYLPPGSVVMVDAETAAKYEALGKAARWEG